MLLSPAMLPVVRSLFAIFEEVQPCEQGVGRLWQYGLDRHQSTIAPRHFHPLEHRHLLLLVIVWILPLRDDPAIRRTLDASHRD